MIQTHAYAVHLAKDLVPDHGYGAKTLGSRLRLLPQAAAAVLIDSLPTELLTLVFSMAADQADGVLDVNSLILLSHVSRKWRDVLLGSPTLWSTIDFNLPRFVGLCLERAQDAPLALRGRVTATSRVDFPSVILDHIPHTRHLSVSFESDYFQELTPILEVPPAPVLEILTLRVSAELPENLFQGFTPYLRKLHLAACELPWKSSSLSLLGPGLTHLTLVGVNRPSQDSFIKALSGMPNLISLSMSYSLPPPVDPQVSSRTVFLAHLQELHLVDEMRKIPSYLDTVFFHRTVAVNITCDSWDDEFTSLLQSFSHFITPSEPVRSLSLEHSPTSIYVRGTDKEVGDRAADQWKSSAFSSTILSTFDDTWSSSAESIATFCNRLLLSHVTSLYCSSQSTTVDPAWIRIFGIFPRLQHLVLGHLLVPSFVAYIEKATEDGTSWSLDVLRICGRSIGEELVGLLNVCLGRKFTLRKLCVEGSSSDHRSIIKRLANLTSGRLLVEDNSMSVSWFGAN